VALSEALAPFFSYFLRAGVVPDSFKEALSTALLKSVKPGQRVDPASPGYYRCITVANILARLYGSMILTRCSHWSERLGLTSESQNAFQAGRNCEQHVISLIELLQARRRRNCPTWVVFVDFKKAYDMVDHAALWRVLRYAGVPEALVVLLERWNTGRTSRLQVNGELSDPFEISVGVPQGDVLSPWLFNIFIESLIRTIRADPVLRGVHEFGMTIKELMYADDLSCPCDDRDQSQRALDIVNNWCRYWGMEMNIGCGKTEVVVFGVKGGVAHQTVLFHPLKVDDQTVPVSEEYRYLGMHLSERTDWYRPIIDRYANRLRDNYNRFFRSSAYVRQMPLRAQSIVLRTYVTSTVNFLAAALPADDPAACSSMDKQLRRILANLLGLPHNNVPVGTLMQDGRMHSTRYAWVRERTRVYLDALSESTHNPRILLHLILMRQTAPAFRHESTWLAQTERMFQQSGLCGHPCQQCGGVHAGGYVPALTPGGSHSPTAIEARSAAASLARDVDVTAWANSARDAGGWRPERWMDRPPAAPKAFRHWLNCGYGVSGNVRARAGPYKHTPLSFTAPGGSGNIILNANVSPAVARVLLLARQGSAAYLYSTEAAAAAAEEAAMAAASVATTAAAAAAAEPGSATLSTAAAAATAKATAAAAVAARARDQAKTARFKTPTCCAACGNAEVGDPYHFLFECTACTPARQRAQLVLRSIIAGIIEQTRIIIKGLPTALAKPMLTPLVATTLALSCMTDAEWASPAGTTIMARLSYAHPWAVIDLPPHLLLSGSAADRLAVALGRLFDAVNWPPFITQALCSMWTARAAKAHRIVNVVRDASHRHQPASRRDGRAAQHARALATAGEAAAAGAAGAAAVADGPPDRHYSGPSSSHVPIIRCGAASGAQPLTHQALLPAFFRRQPLVAPAPARQPGSS